MKKLRFVALCTVFLLTGFIYRLGWQERNIKKASKSASMSTTTRPTTNPWDEDLRTALKLIEWSLPPHNTTLEFSTHPRSSEFFLLQHRSSYIVGEKIEVVIIAKDHKGRRKTYGGDFFHAKLHSPSLKAGVSGSVTDNHNGSYTASFTLQWPGETMVSIKLMHSSEAIAILIQKRTTRPDKVFFKGYFVKNQTEEVVECNFDLPGQDVCEYYDSLNEEKWVCKRPKTLPCDAYRDHSSGGNRVILNKTEQQFFSMSLIEQELSSHVNSFNVLPQEDYVRANNTCESRLKNPNPSGFYYKDIWTSLMCSNQDFNTSIKVANCLANKMVYMFGDSTLRQWWEYLAKFVPSLKQIDLHVTHNTGPLLATDSDNNYIVEWRAHQKPLRMERTGVKDLHYIATELHRLGPRKNMIVVLTCWSHFLTYPMAFYVRRLWHIREAITQLLDRSPDTKILIKSANTGYKFDHGSDWLSYQLDTVMRAMFSELPVIILDVWQMTSCHREPENLHPVEIIIKNEVDLMLSFICPQ